MIITNMKFSSRVDTGLHGNGCREGSCAASLNFEMNLFTLKVPFDTFGSDAAGKISDFCFPFLPCTFPVRDYRQPVEFDRSKLARQLATEKSISSVFQLGK